MLFEYAYEVAGVIFLSLIVIKYSAKSWLPLRANQIFSLLIYTTFLFTLLDMGIRAIRNVPAFHTMHVHYFLGVLSTLGFTWILVLFFSCFYALTEHLKSYTDSTYLVILFPAVFVSIVAITTPWTHFIFYYDEAIRYHRGPGSILFALAALFYILGICVLVFKSSQIISRGKAVLTVVLFLIIVGVVLFQINVLHDKYLLMFYFADVLVVVFYLLYQNLDRFADKISGGFSRAGFRQVVRERCLYQESFGCLFVVIRNYQNITSICADGELYEVMGEIGAVLRKYGGRHNQYHVHGSDFAVMQRSEEDVLRLYQEVSQMLPSILRINDRNVTVNYSYYMLTLEEANYNRDDYFNIMSSMKKKLKGRADNRHLMRYEGEIKDEVLKELYIGKRLKGILSDHRYDIRFLPMIDTMSEKCSALEVFSFMTREDGEPIPEEDVWQVAKEMGCMKEIGHIVADNTMRLVSEEKLLEKGIEKIHLNVTPMHICSDSAIRGYRKLSEKYHIPMSKICMEITEDVGVSQEILRKYLNQLKEIGVELMLDRYGENICNLQSIMNMPFDMVTINRQMLHRYCRGESNILEYQINILKETGWKICLDGVDTEEEYRKAKLLQVEYLQGNYFSRPVSAERLRIYLEEDHGTVRSL